jgi:hypothetical protein
MVQFEGGDSYQGMPSGVPQKAVTHARFSGCHGWSQRLKPV